MIDVHVPRIGMSMESAILVKWLRRVGDVVSEGEPIAEIEAEKAITELESPAAGTLRERLVEADDEVAPGDVIARIDPS